MPEKAGELYQVDYDRNTPDASKWERVNFALRRIFLLIDQKLSGTTTYTFTVNGE